MNRLPMPDLEARGTPRLVDFRLSAMMRWPAEHRPSFEELAAEDAVVSRREQGLPERIADPSLVSRLATLFRGA